MLSYQIFYCIYQWNNAYPSIHVATPDMIHVQNIERFKTDASTVFYKIRWIQYNCIVIIFLSIRSAHLRM